MVVIHDVDAMLLHPPVRSLLRDRTEQELMEMASYDSIPNVLNAPAYVTRVRSRSAPFTEIVYNIGEDHLRLLGDVWDYLRWQQMIRVSARIGSDRPGAVKANLYCTRRFARLPFMFMRNFFPIPDSTDSDITVVTVPEWHQRKVLVFPRQRCTYFLGLDYYGEVKMSALRMAMHITRENWGGVGLHAGSKLVRIEDDDKIKDVGMLVFGLSGTGKTTITCSDFDLVQPEGVEVLQDDINMLMPNGTALGTERNFYIKTDNVSGQPVLLTAANSPRAILENVFIDEDERVNFDQHSISTNGRAIVRRDDIRNTSQRIDLPRIDIMSFNMRRYEIPPIGRLVTPAQAAAYFMLGESTVTSAEDPARVGQSKRVPGFDPFIIDDPFKNANRIMEILRAHPHIKCYVLSTGRVGGRQGANITPAVTFACINGILRNSIEWRYDDILGYEVPVSIPVENSDSFDPYKVYGKEEFVKIIGELRKERKEFLSKHPGLARDIIDAV